MESRKTAWIKRAVLEPMHADARANRVYVARAMKAASEAAGFVPRITFHDLRRSYGSLMLNSGASIESIQQVLGHADTRMTRPARPRQQICPPQQMCEQSCWRMFPAFPSAAGSARADGAIARKDLAFGSPVSSRFGFDLHRGDRSVMQCREISTYRANCVRSSRLSNHPPPSDS